MAGFLTDSTNDAVLDMIFGGRPYTPPDRLWVGLSRAKANRAGVVVEPECPSYRPVCVSNTMDFFAPSVGGEKSNRRPIVFPDPLGEWGTIESVFIRSEGEVIGMADLPEPKKISAGGPPPSIAVGRFYLAHS